MPERAPPLLFFRYDGEGDSAGILQTKNRYFVSLACDTVASHYFVVQDNDMMYMEFNLYNGKAIPQNLLFVRKKQKHWWITGFRRSIGTIPSENLTMEGSITFPNEKAAKGFKTSVKPEKSSRGKAANPFNAQQSGSKVSFTWGELDG